MPTALLPRRGRPGVPLVLEYVRDITQADIERLVSTPAPKVAVQAVQRITAVHRLMAQCVARGMGNNEVALVCGVSAQRIHQLKTTDPSFIELVAYFQDQYESANIEDAQRINAKLLDMAEIALDSMMEQLEADPSKVAISERRQILQLALDRTVAPPRTAQAPPKNPVNITLNITRPQRQDEAERPPIIIEQEQE